MLTSMVLSPVTCNTYVPVGGEGVVVMGRGFAVVELVAGVGVVVMGRVLVMGGRVSTSEYSILILVIC